MEIPRVNGLKSRYLLFYQHIATGLSPAVINFIRTPSFFFILHPGFQNGAATEFWVYS